MNSTPVEQIEEIFAEMESVVARERSRAAKARGVAIGRPFRIYTAEQRRVLSDESLSGAEVAERLSISVGAARRWRRSIGIHRLRGRRANITMTLAAQRRRQRQLLSELRLAAKQKRTRGSMTVRHWWAMRDWLSPRNERWLVMEFRSQSRRQLP